MGFFEWLFKDELKDGLRDLRAAEHAGDLIALAASRNKQVECKVCGKVVSELAAICPNCGEPLPGLRMQCPNCSSCHVTVENKGFSLGQATAGAIAVGPLGLAAGMIGSKDSRLVCLGCNHKWNIAKRKKPRPTETGDPPNIASCGSPVMAVCHVCGKPGGSLCLTTEGYICAKCFAEAGGPVCHVCVKFGGRLFKTTEGRYMCAGCFAEAREGESLVTPYPSTKRLRKPYVYCEDIGKYRCEYCAQIGKRHYFKTLRRIKKHINEHPWYEK